jgi:glycosyl transferase family 1
MSIQLYGQFSDYASIANVSRALACELRRRNARAFVYTVGQSGSYKEPYLPVGLENGARTGIYVGYPESAPSFLQGHTFKVLVTVCETDHIPGTWVDACKEMDLIVVPSEWCRAAFENSGVKKPIIVVRHGIWSSMLDLPDVRTVEDHLTFLHVSGAASFPARKGTSPLLLAFRRFLTEINGNARLILKMARTGGLDRALSELELESNVILDSSPSLTPPEMGLLLKCVDAVVQPSRAEGFGIVPLEAKCVGTPSILTNCTGHTEHFAVNTDVQIPNGRLSIIETQGNPIGSAPEVYINDIFDGLVEFARSDAQHKERTRDWSSKNARNWLWNQQLKPLVRLLLEEDKGTNKRIKLGSGSSLRGA